MSVTIIHQITYPCDRCGGGAERHKRTAQGFVCDTDTEGKYKVVREVADVTSEILEDAEALLDGWFSNDERIDWEDFIDRLAKRGDYGHPPYDFDDYDCPAVRKIKRHVRALKAQS